MNITVLNGEVVIGESETVIMDIYTNNKDAYADDYRRFRYEVAKSKGEMEFLIQFHPIKRKFYIYASCIKQSEFADTIYYLRFETNVSVSNLEYIMTRTFYGKKYDNVIYFKCHDDAQRFLEWVEASKVAMKMRDI